MFWNRLKTALLLSALSALLLFMGKVIGGNSGVTFAFILALFFNVGAYFYSDKIVLRMYRAVPLDHEHYAHIYAMVTELAHASALPVPRLWYIDTRMANAFATGRNPAHASIAVTRGIIELLDDDELRGVLAHELSHVKNRDILVGTVAATIATAIGYLANILQWSFILGGTRERENGTSGLGALFVAILMPIAAALIQLAISRSREYLADESGATCSHDPLALASALEKLSISTRKQHLKPTHYGQTSTASLFIVYPFSGKFSNLFSTHPPIEKRIERLRNMVP